MQLLVPCRTRIPTLPRRQNTILVLMMRVVAAWALLLPNLTTTALRVSYLSPVRRISQPSLYSKPQLPDYNTSVEIDKIKLEERGKPWRREELFGKTLVDETMQDLDDSSPDVATAMTDRAAQRRALTAPNFSAFLRENVPGNESVLKRKPPTVLQINIGLYCNQACGHCHVESSPLRTEEMMSTETVAQCLELLVRSPSIQVLDITGGAPELNENFRYLVGMARSLRPDIEIIDRCNLTVLQEPGQEDLLDFLKTNRVRIVASLPCYSKENVDKQRGGGVFERSVAALLALNDAGYGMGGQDSDLKLDLVYNPLGAFLPPDQAALEVQYKKQLDENFGILFDNLLTFTNMPIKRFADFLHRRDELKEYMDLLVRNFNPETTANLMCLDIVSVGYDGKVYDCDFNQQLGMSISKPKSAGELTVFDMETLRDLGKYAIRTDSHCFGCTAGMGSS